MTVHLTKDSIDLGIVTTEPEKMLAFYCDVLGLELKGEMPMAGGGRMYRLLCGSSLIKIVTQGKKPPEKAAPGGLAAATGYRYFTLSVNNLEELVAKCREAGYKIPVPKKEVRPGINIAMVEDPDGKWVEFLQAG